VTDGAAIFWGDIGPDQGSWGAFSHHYPLDFSALTKADRYRLRLFDGTTSSTFVISQAVYNDLADLSRRFFTVQRSGNTKPVGHAPSHLWDATLSTDPERYRNVMGGWYDAGDYLKFTLTNAYATLFQLLAYRDAPHAFQEFDAAGIPQILNEARVGLDWLERMWRPNEPMLYVQVGSEADHHQPWVLPEDDPLSATEERPVYPAEPGRGANLAGKTAAVFAVAAQIYGDPASPLHDQNRADHYRELAEAIYTWGETRPASQPSFPDYFYNERTWQDDMALAAAELYQLTGETPYLEAARSYAQAAGPGWWFSWEALNGLAHAELARIDPDQRHIYLEFLKQDLMMFQAGAGASPWGMTQADNLVWGSLYPVLGAALEAIWYEALTGDASYRDLAQDQLDYVFGRNPWGVSFLIGAGTNWPQEPHHRISRLSLRPLGLKLEGAWLGGPVAASVFNEQGISLANGDEYARFQSEQAVYHDDINDYVTNEASIPLNATGLLLMATLAEPISEIEP
jgi:hypothetical protein